MNLLIAVFAGIAVPFLIAPSIWIEEGDKFVKKIVYFQSLNNPDLRDFPDQKTKDFVKEHEEAFNERYEGEKLSYIINFYQSIRSDKNDTGKFCNCK